MTRNETIQEFIAISESVAALLPLETITRLVDDAVARPRNQFAELHYYHSNRGTVVVALVGEMISVITDGESAILKAELEKLKRGPSIGNAAS